MRAVVRETDGTRLLKVAAPAVIADDDVVVDVRCAGLCRTDVFVADGVVPVAPPRIVGHEFAGEVRAVGAGVSHVGPGDRVTVNPLLPCGACVQCTGARPGPCQSTAFLGIERDGAFAERVRVPASAVHPIGALGWREGAYSEPVAASLAVMKTGIRPGDRGLVYGDNRIAELTAMILRAHGFADLEVGVPEGRDGVRDRADRYDFVVETLATTETLADILDMVRPGGRIVLKSRRHQPAGLVVNRCVQKEIVLEAVAYGRFDAAVALMAEGRIDVAPLFGADYPIEAWDRMLDDGRSGESLKLFLTVE